MNVWFVAMFFIGGAVGALISLPVFEVFVPAGQKLAAPAHKNDAYEEILYGIQGVLTWTVDDTPIEVGPGQALCIPRGAVHRFDNFGKEDVKQLAVISPAFGVSKQVL